MRKVLVMRQRRFNLLRFHHLKARTIRQAPTLILPSSISFPFSYLQNGFPATPLF
jgi:hypothetical protein